jgi:hypothetical protein
MGNDHGEEATVLATALAAPMTVNAMARMTGRDAMMIGSVVRSRGGRSRGRRRVRTDRLCEENSRRHGCDEGMGNDLATALAAPMTVNAMARMTGRDAMMIGSVVRRIVSSTEFIYSAVSSSSWAEGIGSRGTTICEWKDIF